MTNSTSTLLDVALKEWNATTAALEAGRQILLLRKGGLLDPDGTFELEYPRFWLAPTRFHQDVTLVKPADAGFLAASPVARETIRLRSFASVEKTWPIPFEDANKLTSLDHIWSERWLETRFDYQPEKPLLVVALRVFIVPEPYEVEMLPEYSGCKSWIEMKTALSVEKAYAVQSDAEFAARLAAAKQVLDA